ncbi:hypothetical protein A0256_19630 [Mucilaginibacter sp. PAMC 26640]|nr:hypothetical protein A0256_19630 [Mucilaginibacter sp. PAMC 26640]
MSQNRKVEKNTAIETLRGVAIVLMVSGHVIGAKSTDGLKVADDSIWRFFYYTFEYIRMPLFTVISGYIYAYKPLSKFASNGQFVSGKLNRLLIPLIVVSTLFYVIQHFTPGVNYKNHLTDIRYIYLYPYAHFWFLQGMLVVFLIIMAFENLNLLSKFIPSIIWLSVFTVIFIAFPYKFNNFSVHKVPFLLTFFTLGLILKRFYTIIFHSWILKIAGLIFLCMFSYQLYIFNHPENIRLNNLLTFFVGSTACILLIGMVWKNDRFIWLGGFSYAIYLFHIFGSVASRVVMAKLSIHNKVVQIIFGIVIGIAFPIVLQLLLGRFKFFSVILFGEKIRANKAVLTAQENDKLIHQRPASGNAVV